MPIFSKAEFAEICGLKVNHIATYVKRGKITLTKNGDVDDTVSLNAIFKQERSFKLQSKNSMSEVDPSDKIDHIPVDKRAEKFDKSSKNHDRLAASPEEVAKRWALETEKKSLDTQKTEEEIKLLKLKREKISGEVIPTDLVTSVFTRHFKSVNVAFKNAADNLIMEFQKLKNLSLEEVASLRGTLIPIINKAVDDGIKESMADIDNIVSEYSDKKGVGERS